MHCGDIDFQSAGFPIELSDRLSVFIVLLENGLQSLMFRLGRNNKFIVPVYSFIFDKFNYLFDLFSDFARQQREFVFLEVRYVIEMQRGIFVEQSEKILFTLSLLEFGFYGSGHFDIGNYFLV